MFETNRNKDVGVEMESLESKLAALQGSLQNVAGELDQRHSLFSDSEDPREDVKRAIAEVEKSLKKLRKANPRFNQ